MPFQGLLGIGFFILLAYIFSENRKMIDWKLVTWAMALQFIFAGIFLGNPLTSLSLVFIFIYMIITYNIHVILKKTPLVEFLIGFIVTVLGTWLFTISFSAKYAIITRNVFWNLFLIVGFIRVLMEKKLDRFFHKYWSNFTGIVICISVYGTLFVTKTTGAHLLHSVSDSLMALMSFSQEGGKFLYGSLFTGHAGWIFAIKITTSIIFFTALVAIVDSFGVLNITMFAISRFVNWSMQPFGIKPLSGVEVLISITNIPFGTTNLLMAKNYLNQLTNSEISLILSGVMATIFAAMFAAFVALGISANHLLAASVMSVPAVMALSKILVPETEKPVTLGQEIGVINSLDYRKPLSALISSINDGIKISLFVCASLLVFISLLSMFDGALLRLDKFIDGNLLFSIFHGEKNMLGEFKGIMPGSMRTLFGYLFAPLAFAIGVPVQDMLKVGYLMGTKFSMNEIVAFTKLGEFMKNNQLQQVSVLISSFALCGFANPGTIAFILGIVSPYIKDKKREYARYTFIALFLGAAASWTTAAVASLFTHSSTIQITQ